jgi:hypothetical protein
VSASALPSRLVATGVAFCALVFGADQVSRGATPSGGAAVTIDEPVVLPCPAKEGSTEPNLSVDPRGVVHLSWLETRPAGGPAFLWSALQDGKWTEPRVAAEGDSLVVDWANLPALLPLADGRMVAAWPWRAKAGGSVLRLGYSTDGGTSWSVPVEIAGDGAGAELGFAALTPEGEGVRVVWTAGRAAPARQPQGAAAQPAFGLCTAILGFNGSLSKTQVIDPLICDHCAAAAARTAAGVLVAYRDLDSAGTRDIRLAPLSGQTAIRPYPGAADGWVVPGCPTSGPAMDAAGARIALAWYTVRDGAAQVRVGFSEDGGKTLNPIRRVDDGGPRGRLALAQLDDASAVVSWLESRGDSALFVARHVPRSGPLGPLVNIGVASGRRNSGLPRMVRHGDELVFAWQEPGRPSRVLVSRARIRK